MFLASLGEGDPRLSAHLFMAIAEIHSIARIAPPGPR